MSHPARTARIAAVILRKMSPYLDEDSTLGTVRRAAEAAAAEVVEGDHEATVTTLQPVPRLKPTEPDGEVSDGTVIVRGVEIPPQHLAIIDTRTGVMHTRPTIMPGVGAKAAAEFLPGMPPELIERAYTEWLTSDIGPEQLDAKPGVPWPEDRR